MFEKAKEFAEAKKPEIAGVSSAIVASGIMVPMSAFAEGESNVNNVLTTGVTSAVTSAQDAIMAVLPQALLLMGIVLGITVGVRLFKRIGKQGG